MDENKSIQNLFDSIIHDKTEKKIMNLILDNMDLDEIIKELLLNNGEDNDD